VCMCVRVRVCVCVCVYTLMYFFHISEYCVLFMVDYIIAKMYVCVCVCACMCLSVCVFVCVCLFLQDSELKRTVDESERIKRAYGHYFDYTIVNDNLEGAYRSLRVALERL